MDCLSGKFKREGLFVFKANLSYPRYLLIPEYSNEKDNDFYYYIIDCNGRVKIEANRKFYLGEISVESLKRIVETIKNIN